MSMARPMTRVIWLASLLAVGACGDDKLAKLETIRDEVCACATVACGEAAMKKLPQDKIDASRKTQRVARDMLDCMAELYAKGVPTTDPDAPADVPAAGSAAP